MSESATREEAGAPFRPYSWRHAFMKATLPPTSKLILHTIAAHFGEAGEPAYPKIETIARRASLTDRAVKKHLRALIGVWLQVERLPHREKHQEREYTRYFYLPRYPEALIAFEQSTPPGEPRSRAPRSPVKDKEPIKKNKTSPNPISPESEMGHWFLNDFWPKYPNKAAQFRAWKTLQRISPDADTRAQILDGLQRWVKTSDLKSAPLASTWLRLERWREALQRRIPWQCSACGRPAGVGDGRDYWCREHDPDRRPT